MKINRQNKLNRIFSIFNILKHLHRKNKSSQKVIYTVIVGNYDIIPVIHDYIRDDWDYVCFTDNKTLIHMGKFGQWRILPLQYNRLDDTRNARWHKTHPVELFPDCSESLWVDANVNILTPYIYELIEQSEVQMLVPKHYCRTCVFQEIEVVKGKKETVENAEKIEQFLQNEAMPHFWGLNETNIIYRKHNILVQKVMDDWWKMIESYSKRDQLSFSYVLWKNGIVAGSIDIPNARIDFKNYRIYVHDTDKNLTGRLLSFIFPSK